MVIAHHGRRKWIKAGSLKDARILKREIESMEESRRLEKLGLANRDKRIDDFFQEYAEYVKPRTAPNTVKRYLAVLNTFVVFLKMFHPNLKYLSQIKPEIIESYQQKRLESLELKVRLTGISWAITGTNAYPCPRPLTTKLVCFALLSSGLMREN